MNHDEALTISNPRLLSAIYFGLLAIIVTIIIDTALYLIGVPQILPFYQTILLAVIVAAVFGCGFGERIVHSTKPWRHAFGWAFLMVLVALPFYNLGLFYLLAQSHDGLLAGSSLKHIIYMYFVVLLYSFVLAGLWIAILAGFAAVFLRSRLVYYLLHSLYERRQVAGKGETVIKHKTAKHGQTTVELPEEEQGKIKSENPSRDR